MKVIVVDYDPAWFSMFEEEAMNIKDILGEELVAIHHIGSTSVKHLKAKPIIDILPVVRDIEKVDLYNTEFEKLGYESMGAFGVEGRRYFRKGGENRTHQVHVFEERDHYNIERHLAVRDYLRTHPEDVTRYGKLKQQLAILYSRDIEGYCDGKDAFVKALEERAVAWLREML